MPAWHGLPSHCLPLQKHELESLSLRRLSDVAEKFSQPTLRLLDCDEALHRSQSIKPAWELAAGTQVLGFPAVIRVLSIHVQPAL